MGSCYSLRASALELLGLQMLFVSSARRSDRPNYCLPWRASGAKTYLVKVVFHGQFASPDPVSRAENNAQLWRCSVGGAYPGRLPLSACH